MADLPETRADWLVNVIVRLIRPDIVSALRQVEAQARAEALEEAARVADKMETIQPYKGCGDIGAAIRALKE